MNFNYKQIITMKQILCMAAFAAVLFTSCKQPFKKTKDGMEYKVVKNEKGKKAVVNGFIQLNIIAKYKDSILYSTEEAGSPRFIPYDTARLPEFFKNVQEGDSIIIKTSTDTLIKQGQGQAYMKKNQFIFQYLKVAKVFATQQEAEVAAKSFEATAQAAAEKRAKQEVEKKLAENADQLKKDDVIIAAYLAKNNIQATKTKWGTYVAVITPGTGAVLTEKDVAEVNYTGRNLKDSVFDSNTDPRFGHVQPYPVKLNQYDVIAGWIDGLKTLQKGSVAKLIIPSSLAYGKDGKGGNIGPNEILVFDINVLDVLNDVQYQAKMEAMQKEMMEKRQQEMEEQSKKMKKSNPVVDTTKNK
jgi:FKBP-type peptidyl-prolyl cis-trans isomerase FkpA